ncbi:ATP-binding cassette domain-containing protein [Candidatus Pelagibacter sp. Uisw_130]|uniref:ATP-binding cassette domain-containing protein n=1 Tax=Candidatus Pelagibacter sp. Uisw_130 TaxID=3230989 RepID=UPI0039EB4D24
MSIIKNNKSKIPNLFEILNFKEKLSLIFLFVISVGVIMIELVALTSIPVLFSQLLDFKTDNKIIDAIIDKISKNSTNNFSLVIYGIIIIFFFRSLFLYFAKIFEFIVYKRIRLRLSKALLGNFLGSNLLEIQKDTPATKIWKMEILNNLIGVMDNIVTLIKNICFISVIFIFFLSYLGSEISYFFGTLLFFTGIFYLFFANLIKKTGARTQLAAKNRINTLQNIMNGIKDIFILNKFEFFKEKFKNFNTEYEKNAQKNIIINNFPVFFIEFIGVIFICLFTLRLHNSGLSVEKIISIIGVLAYGGLRLIAVIKGCLIQFNGYKTHSFVISVVLNELRKRVNDNYNDNIEYKDLDNVENLIEIKNLKFAYDKNKTLIQNTNISFKKNKLYALLGESGTGKSTFLDLILGIYESNKETIKINCLREKVGYIPQESYISSGSIKENIAFGVKESEIDEGKINNCMKMAKIYDFVNSLPKKIDSTLEIFGTNISIGQKQRIGIARALYFDPKIILMDEPTSALDSATEKNFIDTLKEIKLGRLIIMTTHKKNFMKDFDYILKIEDGEIKQF